MTSSTQSTLASSLRLHRWLARDSQWKNKPVAWRAGRQWQALWGSVNLHLSQAIASQEGSAKFPDPILIAGPWRSGTTVMHELLVAATGGTTPLTWQCMNAAAFQLRRPVAAEVTLERPMDGLQISGNSPQEDEFALLTMGVPSAYRAFIMPHRIGELAYTLNPSYWAQEHHWLPLWEQFLKGVWRTAANARAPLILKSPNHTFRIPAILRRFPDAKVVWMARPATDVFLSNRKMWRAMFTNYGITPEVDPGALDRFLAEALSNSAKMLIWCRENLPSSNLSIVKQIDLLERPSEIIQDVCHQLGEIRTQEASALGEALDRVRHARVDSYSEPTLPPGVHQAISVLDTVQSEVLSTVA